MTKPIETLRRGNGGLRLNKVEKDDPTVALPTHSHIVYSEGPCGWAEGCVWRGRLLDGLCAEHRSEGLRRERVRRWQEGRSKPTPPKDYNADHTAPWRCSLEVCEVCVDKPTYEEWVACRV